MEQYTGSQYDDDLTVGVGTDDYDDSYISDAVDLFEFSADDESPISRLKSLILSIDWEITDDVLIQFSDELADLKHIWAGDKVNLVYVQALEKISKYIYQHKADAHPNSIKLLLALYYNLEKIVSSGSMSEEDKKNLLVEDVQKFENLKRQISGLAGKGRERQPIVAPRSETAAAAPEKGNHLFNLKAIVLGIDWEITDSDLLALRQEVLQLESRFHDSKPKLLLLQGIGNIGAYIRHKKSNAHSDAFKVLHLFYESLEKMVKSQLSLEDEKAILLPAVARFNDFKAAIASTIEPETLSQEEPEEDDEEDTGVLTPAFADIPEEEVQGFQADLEAKALGIADPDSVASHVDTFFTDGALMPLESSTAAAMESDEESDSLFDPEDEVEPQPLEVALQGVDVESDDDELDAEEGDGATAVAFLADETDEREQQDDAPIAEESVSDAFTDDFFAEMDSPEEVDPEVALQGVNVETDADDDTDEDALPLKAGELAPALSESEEESLFSSSSLETALHEEFVSDEISGRLSSFFADDQEEETAGEGTADKPVADELAPALVAEPEGDVESDGDSPFADDLTEQLESFFADESEDLLKGTEEVLVEDSTDELLNVTPAVEISPPLFEDGVEENEFESDEEPAPALSFFEDDSPAEEAESDVEQDGDLFAEELALFNEEVPAEDLDLLSADAPSGDQGDVLADDLDIPEKSSLSESGEDVVAEDIEALFDDFTEADEAFLGEKLDDEVALVESEVTESAGELAEVSFDSEALEDEPVPVEAETEVEIEKTEELLVEIETDEPTVNEFSDQKQDAVFTDEPLTLLGSSVESLALELNDEIFQSIAVAISSLQGQWQDKPLERTFLQLFQTVSQHIEKYRYESSSEGFGLLTNLLADLQGLEQRDPVAKQEKLLEQTTRVLAWQQGMLSRQEVEHDGQVALAHTVRVEADQADLFTSEEFLNGEKDELTSSLDDILDDERSEHLDSQEVQQSQPALLDLETSDLPESLKKELTSLRQTLQSEIAELRRELQERRKDL